MTDRPRVDQLTDDMLDQLYAELWHLRLDKEGAGLTLRTVTRRAQEQRERAEKAESELDRLTAMASRYSDRAIENGERADRAEDAIARVRALHERYRSALTDDFDCCSECNRTANDLVPFPCATLRALDGTA